MHFVSSAAAAAAAAAAAVTVAVEASAAAVVVGVIGLAGPARKDVFSASDAFMADVEHTCLGVVSRASRFLHVSQL